MLFIATGITIDSRLLKEKQDREEQTRAILFCRIIGEYVLTNETKAQHAPYLAPLMSRCRND